MCYSNKMCFFIAISLALILSCRAQNAPQNYIGEHNKARAKVGVVPLKWDEKLASYARNHASSKKEDCKPVHSGGPYGENIAVRYPGIFSSSGNATVQSWVEEGKYYDHGSNTCATGKVCDHYTQVVWKSSTSLGCARAPCSRGRWLVVCNYDPRGNIDGHRPY